MIVFVLNKHKQPSMPCSPAKARKLLKEGEAKVIRREPFLTRKGDEVLSNFHFSACQDVSNFQLLDSDWRQANSGEFHKVVCK